jgi:hypothetical protein
MANRLTQKPRKSNKPTAMGCERLPVAGHATLAAADVRVHLVTCRLWDRVKVVTGEVS